MQNFMKKKKINTKKSTPTKAEEPIPVYGENRIIFFKSFEEMNDFDHHYYSTLSYNERLNQLISMLSRIYRAQLEKKPTLGNKIFFD